MSVNIPTHYVQQFSSNIQLLLQQRGSKLRNLIMSGTQVGKQASPVDQFGAVEALKVTGRFQAMPRVDASTDRRWVFPVDYHLPQLLDNFDKLRLLTDPSSSYVMNAAYAMGRAMDSEIIAAMFGDAKTGETATTTTPFDSNQIVDSAFGSGGGDTGLTVAKLREAKRILMANEVDMETDRIICVVTAKQHDDLLSEATVVSTDFNDRPVLVDGKVTRFLGIDIVHSERLTNTADPYRQVPVFAQSGLYLGIWGDISTAVSIREDITSRPYQAYATGTFGATRLEEKKIVKIECAE